MPQSHVQVRFRPPDALFVKFSHDPSNNNAMNRISGARFNSETAEWIVPDTEENRTGLRKAFGERLIISRTDTCLMKFKDELVRRNFPAPVMKNYFAAAVSFIKWSGKELADATAADIKRYTNMLAEERGFSSHSIKLITNAVELFFSTIRGETGAAAKATPKEKPLRTKKPQVKSADTKPRAGRSKKTPK